MMEWQPIETAPKGPWLLLYVPDGVEERAVDKAPLVTIGNYEADVFQSAQWLSVETWHEFWDYGGMTGAGTSTYRSPIRPTHWMPLPAPPSE